MRLLVTGGRAYNDPACVNRYLTQIAPTVLIHGGAAGADRLAADWALRNGVNVQCYMADWVIHGRAAGPIRNQQMLDDGKPDAVLAFPGGRGTADMVSRARKANIKIIEVSP